MSDTGAGAGAVCVFAPAPLLALTVEYDAEGREELHLHPGGQGFWIARMINALHGRAVMCAPFGGETGEVLFRLIEREGVECRGVEMNEPNGAFVHDRRSGRADVVATTRVPPLGLHELDELYTVTLSTALDLGVCVLAGTQAQSAVGDDVYRRLTGDLGRMGIFVAADLSGGNLRAALDGGVDLLKVSSEELVRDGFSASEERDEIVATIARLQSSGARDVVVSCAGEPAIGSAGGRLYEVDPLRLEVVESVGSGDSMTAGLALAAARGMEPGEGLRLATAAGCLSVARHEFAAGDAAAISALAGKVEVRPLA